MGCCNSTDTAVRALKPDELTGDEDETGSKVDGRGDSAVSKDTADSGVVMEGRDIPVLPGAVPRELPPLPSECIGESTVDRITHDGLLQQESTMQERPKSSEILEELLNQGIIPVGQTSERGSGAGEAYSIMLGDREGVRRRPPARLVSLKATKAQSLPSKEEIEEKMRLAEERRKLREDELKTRLRTKSARVRGPAPTSSSEVDEDAALTPVEPLQLPLSLEDPLDPPPRSQIRRESAEGGERVRESGGDGREEVGKTDEREKGAEKGDNSKETPEWTSEDSDETGEEESTQVEELKENRLLTASGELENDSSFQHAEDKEEIF